MAKPTRSDDWGFPRWRPYGAKGRAAARVRLCDREGCNEAGDRPAPKAPNSPERWMFCEAHAAEYNKSWNYFAGLTPRKPRAAPPRRRAGPRPFATARITNGPDRATAAAAATRCARSTRSSWTPTPTSPAIKAAYRRLAKQYHPDVNQGDKEAAKRFQQVQAAYDVLRKRRGAQGRGQALGVEHEGARRLGDRAVVVAAMGDAADEGDRAGQFVAFAARDHRFALQRRAEIIEPQVDRHDRLEMAERHPHRRAAAGIEQADDRARGEDAAFRHADQFLAPRQGQLDPVVADGAIFQAKRAAMADLARQLEEALGVEAAASGRRA